MKLSELRVSDFALFSSRNFTLQSGINLVAGGNRSGKTLVFQALQAALANRLPDGSIADEDMTPPAVSLEIEQQGNVLKLERVFGHSDDLAGSDIDDPALPVLLEAGFWQDGGLLNLSSDQLSRRLRILTLSGNQGDAQTLPPLQDEYRRLTSRDPWGEDREEPGELEHVRERLVEIEAAWEQRLSALKELGSLRTTELPRDKQPDSSPVADDSSVNEGDFSLEDTDEVPPDHQPVPSFADENVSDGFNNTPDEEWDDPGFEVTPQEDPPKVRERLWSVQKEAAELRQELVSVPSLSALLPIVLTLLFIVLGGTLVAFHRDLWQAVAMAGGGLILCTWAVYGYLARNKGSELGRLRERLARAENEREDLLQTLDRLDEQRRYGSGEDENDQEPVEETLSTPEDPVPAEDVGDEMPEATVSEPKVSHWQQRRRLLTEVSDLRALEMEGELLRYREQQIVSRLKVLATAIEMLIQAEDHFGGERRKKFNDTLNDFIQRLLPDSDIQVALSKNWHLQWLRDDGQRTAALHTFSRGERVLLSLATHLALIVMCGASTLPLIADDLFDDLHDDLRDSLIKVLKTFSATNQVIVTGRGADIRTRARTSGWHVIDLDKSTKTPPKKPTPKTENEGSSDDEQQLHLL